MKAKLFEPSQFAANDQYTAEEKAHFANHFVRFVESGFKPTVFPAWFYRRLSCSFGHIAHFNRNGFYETWFSTTRRRRDFLQRCLSHPFYPAAPFSDAEDACRQWVRKSGLVMKLSVQVALDVEQAERAELARLKAKYETRREAA
jgi:hypothetical protein